MEKRGIVTTELTPCMQCGAEATSTDEKGRVYCEACAQEIKIASESDSNVTPGTPFRVINDAGD